LAGRLADYRFATRIFFAMLDALESTLKLPKVGFFDSLEVPDLTRILESRVDIIEVANNTIGLSIAVRVLASRINRLNANNGYFWE
jgi:hypothetical protein